MKGYPLAISGQVLLIWASILTVAMADPRVFIDKEGHSLRGELVSIAGQMVTLKGEDGKVYTRPADSFCEADITFLRQNGLKAPEGTDANGTTEPAELTNARNRYHLQLDEAAAPIKKRYLPFLENLKRAKGGQGDLKAATLVQREIDGVSSGTLPGLDDASPDLKDARSKYDRELARVLDPIKLRWAQGLENFKKVLGAKGNMRGALAVQNEIDNVDVSLPSVSAGDSRIVIWNQHNASGNDRGSKRINLVLISESKEIWRRDGIKLPWKPNEDVKVELPVPATLFDKIRVEVEEWVSTSGGLAEIECFVGGKNVAKGCKAVSSGDFAPEFSANNVTDGITTSKDYAVGYWLSPDQEKSWIEIDLNKHVARKAAKK